MPKKGKKKKILSDKDTPRSDPIVPEQFEPPPQPREKVGGFDCYTVFIILSLTSFVFPFYRRCNTKTPPIVTQCFYIVMHQILL